VLERLLNVFLTTHRIYKPVVWFYTPMSREEPI